jgi:hypothetical protein
MDSNNREWRILRITAAHLRDRATKHENKPEAKKDSADDFCFHVVDFPFIVLAFRDFPGRRSQSAGLSPVYCPKSDPRLRGKLGGFGIFTEGNEGNEGSLRTRWVLQKDRKRRVSSMEPKLNINVYHRGSFRPLQRAYFAACEQREHNCDTLGFR